MMWGAEEADIRLHHTAFLSCVSKMKWSGMHNLQLTGLWDQYRDQIAGSWKCVKYVIHPPEDAKDAAIYKPHGDQPLGRAVITRDGFLSAHLAVPDQIQQWLKTKDAGHQLGSTGVTGYCGHFELFEDVEGLYWKTRVLIATDPTRIGGDQVRRVKLSAEGGKLVMTLSPVQPFARPVYMVH